MYFALPPLTTSAPSGGRVVHSRLRRNKLSFSSRRPQTELWEQLKTTAQNKDSKSYCFLLPRCLTTGDALKTHKSTQCVCIVIPNYLAPSESWGLLTQHKIDGPNHGEHSDIHDNICFQESIIILSQHLASFRMMRKADSADILF